MLKVAFRGADLDEYKQFEIFEGVLSRLSRPTLDLLQIISVFCLLLKIELEPLKIELSVFSSSPRRC